MAELDLVKVNKTYVRRGKTPVHAVKDFDLEVEKGEIVALLGSSGCGKTSTLRMIAGFEDLSQGTISLAGRPIHTEPPARRGVAMAFEAYSLYPPLTIADNIGFALKASKLPQAEVSRRVGAMAEMLEISGILGKYPGSVSGGEQQRASLGRALVRPADLYLLDEPMGQLEPQLRAVLRGRIKHYLHEHGCTAILVTHDQTEANALAHRIAVMEGGLLMQYASPAELKARPANLFTGTFIGEPPMNVFEAEARVEQGRVNYQLAGHFELSVAADANSPLTGALKHLRRVTLGVRPHALKLGDGPLRGRVTACQWLGDQTHIAADVAGRTVVSVVHERLQAAPGSAVAFSIDAGDLHIFDPDTGRAIAHGGELA